MQNEIAITEQVEKLCVELNVGKLEIFNSEDGTFSYKIENAKEEDFEIVNTDTELSIIDKTNAGSIFSRWFNKGKINNRGPKVTILTPEGHKFESVKIKVAVCKSKIKDILSEKFRLSSGVGAVKMKNVTATELKINGDMGPVSGKKITAKKVKINAGVGPCDFTKSDFYDAKFNCGIGSFNFDGIIKGDSSISAGVGSVNLKLNALKSDYNLHISTGVGRIKIDDEKIDGFSSQKKYSSDSDNKIRIDGGIGKLEIKFLG